MPRISMWKENKTFDYSFHDNRIREMFTIGGTGVNVHKYLGTFQQGAGDATQPKYDTITENRIQDLLFLENRDRNTTKQYIRCEACTMSKILILT